jgi:hypothetical protein
LIAASKAEKAYKSTSERQMNMDDKKLVTEKPRFCG